MSRLESKPSGGNVGKKAAAHPEYGKWMKAAEAVERPNPDDALEHVEDVADSPLYLAARLFCLRRSIGADSAGFGTVGDHEKKIIALAAQFKVDKQRASETLEYAKAAVNASFRQWEQKGMDYITMKRTAEKEIDQLEHRLGMAA